MIFRLFMTRLLAIAIVAGLAVAPVAVPAPMQASMTGMSSVADVSSMSADMPCCPDEQNSKTCTDCPLTAMCVLTTAQVAPPEMSALPVRHAVRTTHALRDDVSPTGSTAPLPTNHLETWPDGRSVAAAPGAPITHAALRLTQDIRG
jgi:hypothetical protein